VVDVTTPWPGAAATDAFRYVLYECGTPKPEGFDGAEFIQIPVSNVIALGTSYIPQLKELGVLNTLIGVDSFDFFNTPEVVQMMPDLGKYVDFVLVIFLAFGASFELPIALVILCLLGWVTPKQLSEWRGYAVVGIFVVAAIITPPDVVSQMMLAVPMMVLYELGIIAARMVAPKKLGATPEGDETPES